MKQDRNGVRTAQDLERKYDFSSIDTLKRNYELQKTSLNKVENELNNFVEATTQNIEDLQNQVDGNIATWFSSGIPTLNNYPANEWTDNDTKNNHLGDLYYDKNTGYGYRFTLEENTYKWIEIKDTDVTQALALANAAQDTADSKRRVFVVQPTPPYDVGDLWLNNEELYRCQITKGESETYASRDWIKATKYTDDTVANQVGNNLTILSGTVTEIRDDVDELSTTMTNTTTLVNEQGETIGTLQEQQSSTSQTVTEISATVASHGHAIDNLEDTVEEHENQLTPTDTASGSSIYLDDSAETELIDFELEGKTTQETSTQSTNLFDESYYNDDSIYTQATYKYVKARILGNRTLYFKASLKEGKTIQPGAYICISESAGSPYVSGTKSAYAIRSGSITNNVVNVVDFTGVNELYINVYPNDLNVSNIFDNYNLWVSTNNIDYVPFTPNMPSPDYPSELVNVGYQNLLNFASIIPATASTTVTLLDTGINLKNTRNGYGAKINIANLKANTDYYISYKWENVSNGLNRVYVFAGSTQATTLAYLNNGTGFKFNTGNNTSINIWFYVQSNSTGEVNYKDIQLLEDTQAHSYIPYGKYGIEVKINGNNLKDNATWYSGYLNNNNQVVSNSGWKYSDYIDISNGKYNYTSAGTGNAPKTVLYNQNKQPIAYLDIAVGTTDLSSYNASYIRISVANDAFSGLILKRQENTHLYTLDNPLRSIGDTKDLLYIKNSMLYVERKIGSVVLDGSEDWIYPTQVGSSSYYRFENQAFRNNDCLTHSNYLSNNFKYNNTAWDIQQNIITNTSGANTNRLWITIDTTLMSGITVNDFKSWLSTHNVEVQYELAEPYTEELGQVDMPSTYKGITYLNTTDELEPNMSIIYVRDLPLTNYVESHYAELKINENSIEARVESIENNGYGDRISAVETKQTSTDLKVNVISTNSGIELDYDSEGKPISGKVREVTTTTGFTFNAEGMTIADSSSSFKAQHKKDGTYYYDGDTIVGQYTKDGSKQKDLELFGVYTYGKNDKDDTPMFIAQLYTDANGEECFGHFYNRGD